MGDKTKWTLARLDELGTPYEVEEHPAVYTIEDMVRLGLDERGEIAKNLFLRDDKKQRYFLVVMKSDKAADLKRLQALLGSRRLSFASEEDLTARLGVSKGAVTPLALLNDPEHRVEAVFDLGLRDAPRLGVHPNENTATVWLCPADLERILREQGAKAVWLAL